jgi:hypothetical protein
MIIYIPIDGYKYTKKLVDINVPKSAQILETIKEPVNFMGWGEVFLVFEFGNEEIESVEREVSRNQSWTRLPLKAEDLINSKYFIKENIHSNRIHDIPISATEGYYFYKGNIFANSNKLEYTFALLDKNNKKFYVLKKNIGGK